MKRSKAISGAFLVSAVLLAGAVPAAANPNNNNSAKLRSAVTVAGILEHEQAFQAISDAAAGNRLSGAPGYDSSAEYVAQRAAAAGFDVEVQEFEYTLAFLADYEAPVLGIQGGTEFVGGIAGASLGGDFGSMFKSTPYSVDVTAPVWAIDLALPAVGPPNTSTSGCQDADYTGMPAGAIIIVQRGTCPFADKFVRADASGAAAMVFINEGQPGRTEPLWFNFAGQRGAQRGHRSDRPVQDRLAPGHLHDQQRHCRDHDRRPRQRDRGRCASGLGGCRAGAQRQRVGFGDDSGDR